MEKPKNMIIRLSAEKLSKYKELCELNGFTMSKRIRSFIDSETQWLEIITLKGKMEKHINTLKVIDPKNIIKIDLYEYIQVLINNTTNKEEIDKIIARHPIDLQFLK